MANRFISDSWSPEMKQLVAGMTNEQYNEWIKTLPDAIAGREVQSTLTEKTKKAIREMSPEDYQKFKKEFDSIAITEENIVAWLNKQQPTEEQLDEIIQYIM